MFVDFCGGFCRSGLVSYMCVRRSWCSKCGVGDMLGLQHVYPKKTRDALWNAIADEDGEIQVEDQEGRAQDRLAAQQ